MAETKTTIPVEIKMGNAGADDANLPAFKEGSIIFTKDTKKIYIDPVGETERIAVGGTEVDLSGKQDKFADISYGNNIATNDKLVLTPNVDNAISEVYFNIDGASDWKMGTKAVSAPYFKTKNGYIIANTSSMPPILMSNVTTQATTPIINFESAANNNATILRGIANGLNDNDAVNVSQLVKKQDKITADTDLVVKTLTLSDGVQIKYSNVASIEGIQFSGIAGDNLVLRKVANGINNDEAVNVSQLNKKQDKFATVTTENTIQTVKIGDDLSIVTSPNLGYSQISSTKILTLSGADSDSSYVSLRKTKLENNCDFDATQGYLRVRNDPLADDFAVNKKYIDDIKTELLNAITHPYTYDETTKELTLIL